MNHIEELTKHTTEHGIDGLLPQNLTDSILGRMLVEIETHNTSNQVPASTLLLAVMSLQNEGAIKNDIKSLSIDFDSGKDLMDKFNNYQIAVIIEGKRRSKQILITDDSLPTLNNIFDGKRKIRMTPID